MDIASSDLMTPEGQKIHREPSRSSARLVSGGGADVISELRRRSASREVRGQRCEALIRELETREKSLCRVLREAAEKCPQTTPRDQPSLRRRHSLASKLMGLPVDNLQLIEDTRRQELYVTQRDEYATIVDHFAAELPEAPLDTIDRRPSHAESRRHFDDLSALVARGQEASHRLTPTHMLLVSVHERADRARSEALWCRGLLEIAEESIRSLEPSSDAQPVMDDDVVVPDLRPRLARKAELEEQLKEEGEWLAEGSTSTGPSSVTESYVAALEADLTAQRRLFEALQHELSSRPRRSSNGLHHLEMQALHLTEAIATAHHDRTVASSNPLLATLLRRRELQAELQAQREHFQRAEGRKQRSALEVIHVSSERARHLRTQRELVATIQDMRSRLLP